MRMTLNTGASYHHFPQMCPKLFCYEKVACASKSEESCCHEFSGQDLPTPAPVSPFHVNISTPSARPTAPNLVYQFNNDSDCIVFNMECNKCLRDMFKRKYGHFS